MINYKIFEETRSIEGREYIAYGIAAVGADGEIICSVSDMTPSREMALGFAEKCERNRLSPIHLFDAVSDWIISDNY